MLQLPGGVDKDVISVLVDFLDYYAIGALSCTSTRANELLSVHRENVSKWIPVHRAVSRYNSDHSPVQSTCGKITIDNNCARVYGWMVTYHSSASGKRVYIADRAADKYLRNVFPRCYSTFYPRTAQDCVKIDNIEYFLTKAAPRENIRNAVSMFNGVFRGQDSGSEVLVSGTVCGTEYSLAVSRGTIKIAKSGAALHNITVSTGGTAVMISGTVYWLNAREIAAAYLILGAPSEIVFLI